MLILGISGSLRRESANRRLLLAAAAKVPAGTRMRLYAGVGGIPPFNEDHEGRPGPAVLGLRAEIAGADALLVSTPEYNGSFPGQLKNALDWVSRPIDANPLRRLPVAVVGASSGIYGAIWAQADMRRVLAAIGAAVLEDELPVGQAGTAFNLRGDLADPEADRALAALVTKLVLAARPVASTAAAC